MRHEGDRRPGMGRALLVFGVVLISVAAISRFGEQSYSTPRAPVPQEDYRLVHAIGNTEHVSAMGLSKRDCEARKQELKAVATAVGTYNEQTGYGSITCLPESLFEDQ